MTAATLAAGTSGVMAGILADWDLYRRSQLIPAGGPDLISARSVLGRLLEPHTRTLGPVEPDASDLEAIDDAADLVVIYAEHYFGTAVATFVAAGGVNTGITYGDALDYRRQEQQDDIAQMEAAADEAAAKNGGNTS